MYLFVFVLEQFSVHRRIERKMQIALLDLLPLVHRPLIVSIQRDALITADDFKCIGAMHQIQS